MRSPTDFCFRERQEHEQLIKQVAFAKKKRENQSTSDWAKKKEKKGKCG